MTTDEQDIYFTKRRNILEHFLIWAWYALVNAAFPLPQELFVESLVGEAYQYTCKAGRKTVSRRDVDNSVEAIDALAFLDGALDWS